jgi:hypothetical protein
MYGVTSTPDDFRRFAAKPHHANRKAEYWGQHDEPRAGLPITKQYASAETAVNGPAKAHMRLIWQCPPFKRIPFPPSVAAALIV